MTDFTFSGKFSLMVNLNCFLVLVRVGAFSSNMFVEFFFFLEFVATIATLKSVPYTG